MRLSSDTSPYSNCWRGTEFPAGEDATRFDFDPCTRGIRLAPDTRATDSKKRLRDNLIEEDIEPTASTGEILRMNRKQSTPDRHYGHPSSDWQQQAESLVEK